MKSPPAYSDTTKTEYPSWDALVHAEANGYMVVAIITKGAMSWPWMQGPYEFKPDAERARNRLRRRMKRELSVPWRADTSFSLFVRPAWKEKP